MTAIAYIVPTALLESTPPGSRWHAQSVPGTPEQSLLIVDWDNPNHEIEFEATPGIVVVGLPWDPLPDAAAPIIAAFGSDATSQTSPAPTGTVAATPAPAPSAAPITVSSALRSTGWKAARFRF